MRGGGELERNQLILFIVCVRSCLPGFEEAVEARVSLFYLACSLAPHQSRHHRLEKETRIWIVTAVFFTNMKKANQWFSGVIFAAHCEET